MSLSILLVASCLQAAAASYSVLDHAWADAALSQLQYSVFVADLSQLESSGVSGHVAVFVGPSGLLGVGGASGLERNLIAAPMGSNCTATNGCGAHVHSGTACTDSATQGGHYFSANTTDPWAPIGYHYTTPAGAATFSFAVTTDARDIAGKPFIVHNNNGGRVACGILTRVPAERTKTATLAPLSGSGVVGGVTIYTTATQVIGTGFANGLEPNLRDSSASGSNCTATNGCGAHVHSGTACTGKATQGGHYYLGSNDPWASVRYSSTSDAGSAMFMFSVTNNATDVLGKPFIVHNNAGGRVACGLLEAKNDSSTTTTTPTTTTSGQNFVPSSATSFTSSMMVTLLVGMSLTSMTP